MRDSFKVKNFKDENHETSFLEKFKIKTIKIYEELLLVVWTFQTNIWKLSFNLMELKIFNEKDEDFLKNKKIE